MYELHLLYLTPDKAVTCSRNTNRTRIGNIWTAKRNVLVCAVIQGALTHKCRGNNKLANPKQLISTALQIKETCRQYVIYSFNTGRKGLLINTGAKLY